MFLRSGWKLTIFNFDTCKLVKTLKGNICLITELKPLYGCQVGKLKPKCRNTENKCQKTMFEELRFQLSLAKNRTILLFLTTCNCCSFSELFPLFFSQNQYNLARAQQSYKSLVQIHEKNGKFTCMRASEARQCGGSLDQSLLAPSLSLSPCLPTQAGTHHPRRTDKEPPSLCTVNTPMGQSILFSNGLFPVLSDQSRDASFLNSWKPFFFFFFPLWLIKRYSSALLPEGLYYGVTPLEHHCSHSFSLSQVMLICIKGKGKIILYPL